MITIFKNKKDIPQDKEYVELNDVYFNQNTAMCKFKIRSRFSEVALDIDMLSTGCKTVLNIMYHTDKIFCMKECGNNALSILYGLECGSVYSDYALIPFDMEKVNVQTTGGIREISDYEELKEWWCNEE